MNNLQEIGARVARTLDGLAQQPKYSIAGAGLTTLLAFYLVHTFLTWYRLSHIPGPFWAGLSKSWIVREALIRREPFTLKALIDKHGDHQFGRATLWVY